MKYNIPHSKIHGQANEWTFADSNFSLSNKKLNEECNDNIKFSSFVIVK